MTRVIIIGANGAMGQLMAETIAETQDMQTVAGIDLFPDARTNAFPVFSSLAECSEEADLLIDFSKPTALEANLPYALQHKLPIIIATTGYSAAQKQEIAKAAQEIPIFFTANMSLGVNLQAMLCQQSAQFFGDLAEIEIIEKHHHRKVDAPSGTALLLADAMNQAMDGKYHYQYGRGGNDCKRQPNEIGIHAIRGGNIVGEHEVEFITDQEILTITHHTENRKVFAIGALRAARFLLKQPIGLYSMKELLASNNKKSRLQIEENAAIVTVHKAPFTVSYFARLMKRFANAGIQAELISQSAASQGRMDLSFSIIAGNLRTVEQLIEESSPDISYMIQRGLCKYTVTGSQQIFHSDALNSFLAQLERNFVDILLLSVIGNTMVFFTESEHRLQVGAILAQTLC